MVKSLGGRIGSLGLALAGVGIVALPAPAQRVSLTDLQNQIAASVTCAAALPGQPRFVDKGDGTICDSATGLMWEKKQSCADSGNPHCVDNFYSWSATPPFIEPTGTLYSDFLGRLNRGDFPSCLGSRCDWRIPTLDELKSLHPDTCGTLCIDPIFGPTKASYYWSSTQWFSQPAYASIVDFRRLSYSFGEKYGNAYARAVRGGR